MDVSMVVFMVAFAGVYSALILYIFIKNNNENTK
tara:strand:- start:10055 stop:10156 length:102 start_codon:yes stop_codon:yes gene_type:complete